MKIGIDPKQHALNTTSTVADDARSARDTYGKRRSEQSPVQHDLRDVEIDEEPRHVDERRDEAGRTRSRDPARSAAGRTGSIEPTSVPERHDADHRYPDHDPDESPRPIVGDPEMLPGGDPDKPERAEEQGQSVRTRR